MEENIKVEKEPHDKSERLVIKKFYCKIRRRKAPYYEA
jgi:hypothetical protein